MNIEQAKEYIKDTVRLYLKKDNDGEYRIPVVRQRPVFLLGAPGVGKTAIMEQIASELGIALVSYSMTHHTRQSALGLPFIIKKEYGGESYDVSEYTMSEIIASIYDVMEKSNIKEGILFLDEINCVSETLAPSMLQFLQYKVFGRHKVPEGWVIVTAGNPPEYNRSVREFDVVTLDRLKILKVEADMNVWKKYALEKRLHGAVINYLEINKEDFYVIDTTVNGRGYVTARGWEDLSQIISLYEEEGLEVTEELVGQYLCNSRIVREFTAYYDLYCKYVSDYHIDDIIEGVIYEQAIEKLKVAGFDEKLSIIGIFTDRLLGYIRNACDEADFISGVFPILKAVKASQNCATQIEDIRIKRISLMESKIQAGAISDRQKSIDKKIISFLDRAGRLLNQSDAQSEEDKFDIIRNMFNDAKNGLKDDVDGTKTRMNNVFEFVTKAFGEGNEMILLLTELTVNADAARFIASFGHDEYSRLSKKLMVDDPNKALLKKIEELDL